MGDYDLQIMVSLVFAASLFGFFMILYAQQPTIGDVNEDVIYRNYDFNVTNGTIVPEKEVEEDPTLTDWIFGIIGLEEEKKVLDEMTAAIGNVFRLLENFEKKGIWIIGIFTGSMGIIGLIIIARFIRGQ